MDFIATPKKDHIRRKLNGKLKNICEISIIVILICQKLELVGPLQQKINFPWLYSEFQDH